MLKFSIATEKKQNIYKKDNPRAKIKFHLQDFCHKNSYEQIQRNMYKDKKLLIWNSGSPYVEHKYTII